MTTYTFRDYRSPKANLYCQLKVHLEYAEFSLDCLRLLVDEYAEERSKPDRLKDMALYRSSIVAFMTIFDPKQHFSLKDEDVYGSEVSNYIDYMKYLWDVRDSHLAHSFGVMAEVRFGVFKAPPDITGLGPMGFQFILPTVQGLKDMHDFMLRTENYLKDQLQPLFAEVQEEIAGIAEAEIMALPELQYTVRAADAIRTSRPNRAIPPKRKPEVKPIKNDSDPTGD